MSIDFSNSSETTSINVNIILRVEDLIFIHYLLIYFYAEAARTFKNWCRGGGV